MSAPLSKPGKHRANLRHQAVVHRDLVTALDTLYPAAPPRLTDTDREVWYKAGQRAVVDLLLTLIRESDVRGNILED